MDFQAIPIIHYPRFRLLFYGWKKCHCVVDNLPNEDLVKLLEKIADIAKSDGKITLEEYDLLKSLSYDTAEYMMTLEESSADGVITDDEKRELLKLKRKILDNAKRIAGKNGVVTDDEAVMIDKLKELLG